jgi:transposase
MLSLPPSVRIFVATQPVDGRKGVDSLAALVRSALSLDPLSGHLYVFFSRRCDRVRVVYWDRNGFAMWTKRLERGRFHPMFSEDGRLVASAIEAAELMLLLEGIELSGARHRPRWERGKAA